ELVRMVEQTSIFENLAAVEFPGRDRWQDLCAANGWDVPPEFDEVDVDDLNDGYAQGSDIQGLMDRRRVANLKRDHKSAVTWLRALSEKQPENKSWKQELRLAEKSRLDELGAEVPQAVGAKDYAKLRGLRRELACDWIAAGSADSLKAQVTLTLAECTAEKLAEAFSSRSEGDLQTHLKDIDDYVASGDFTPPNAMGQQIDMARSWLAVRNEEHAKQQKYDDLVAKITDMVARDRLNLKLVTIWQQLLTMEQQPPGDLVPQVSSCLWEQEDKRIAESRARFLKGILAAVAALILIGAISGAYMSWSGNNTRIQLITQALGRRDVNEARQLLDRLTREKSYLTWRVDVEGFEQQATDIEADIVSKHRAVELALKRLTSVSDTNWKQSPEETATLFDTLHKAITDAGSDAPEGSEKKHNELSKSWESTCSMRQIERNKIFMDRVAALRKRVQDLPAGLQNDTGKLTDLIDQISRLQDEAGRIGMDATGVSGTFKSTLGTVKGDLGTVRECAEMRLKAL
ncbi:MAG: hypothetical protein KAI66_27655, partial [Lentisphaeria bacterium]|nr:hypothetical protein [Lentisphaeria bacterium]